MTGQTEAELAGPLDRLVHAGLLYRRGGSTPHATYLFKHALVQDTAYGTLLRDRRQQIHNRIVGFWKNNFRSPLN